MGDRNNRRWWTVLAAVAAVGVTAAVGYRVLAPAEVSTPARGAYPVVVDAQPGVVGRLSVAPLLVDGRIRVYATTRQVWSDQPADARTRRTAYWSYRRWPAQLSGVVVSGTTVVSRWSDGKLVAVDGRTGRVAWRADGPTPAPNHGSRRTGAATVWTPPGLRTAVSPNGQALVVAASGSDLRTYTVDGGRQLWRAEAGPGCLGDPLTTADGQVVTVDTCANPQVAEFRQADTGTVVSRWRPEQVTPGLSQQVTPSLALTGLDCVGHRSRCAGLRTGDGPAARGWLVERGAPRPASLLDGPDALLVDEVAVTRTANAVVGWSARTGARLWQWDAPPDTVLLAAQAGRVHLRTGTNDLVTLDPATGALRSRFPFTVGRDSTGWAPGLSYAYDGFLAVERLRTPVDPSAADKRYYLATEPVILAVT